MDEDTQSELAELKKEMAELQKTLEEFEHWQETEGAELEAMLRDLEDIAGEAETVQPYRLPDDYPLPREILRQHFPRTANQCNFSGGWGYDAENAVIVKEFDPEINPDEKFDGVSLEYAFIDKRIREELIFSRPEEERFEEVASTTIEQKLLDINGVPHDYILVEVTAYPEQEWNELKADWEAHDGYKADPEGRKCNLDRKEACKVTCQAEYYFNISDFY